MGLTAWSPAARRRSAAAWTRPTLGGRLDEADARRRLDEAGAPQPVPP
ncbi:hypothetical protein [Dactylosporangium aurantiacum]|nr:hypothetical protein [Dactylosporangium aurantiacum]MDG6106431.1 hypothetical protein [Dactylosporangium aurantiacum]